MIREKQKIVEPDAEMKVIKLRLLTPVTRELHYGRTTISLLKISVLNVPKGGFKCQGNFSIREIDLGRESPGAFLSLQLQGPLELFPVTGG
ncbi:hypothetical protein AVEN_190740-1 [Araneus ventricosus]|uniref:Uncharacterized protein n=1 Tax=Araneus ventricosus TaxID=182803 RepID=A0A4Y2Q9S8_ARAVE|nr:hypothetical protein AVEN_255811-1 [Araneus ventricosus]GBN60214.1 hypothetical protein AVEN_160218-1 [Araneus ventricosus]GBN60230.1 hypothetical protein AVEN_190740-1 [Araneus ventricosus]